MRTVNLFCKVHGHSNPGTGAWAVTLEDVLSGTRATLTGGFAHTNLMRLEMTAFLEALSALKVPCNVRAHSFNVTIVNVFNGTWRCRSNLDIWKRVVNVLPRHRCEFIQVRKSDDNAIFRECHKVAVATARRPDLPKDDNFVAGDTERRVKDTGRVSLFSSAADPFGADGRIPYAAYDTRHTAGHDPMRYHSL